MKLSEQLSSDRMTLYAEQARALEERIAELEAPEYQTHPVDYTGCDQEIASFLKRHGGRNGILCKVWDRDGGTPSLGYVIAYQVDTEYPYLGTAMAWRHAKPILKPRVRPLPEVLGLLAEGYTFREGFWFDGKDGWELDFSECGSVPQHTNTWPDDFLI